jgi:hypothetical protein
MWDAKTRGTLQSFEGLRQTAVFLPAVPNELDNVTAASSLCRFDRTRQAHAGWPD